MTIDLFLKTYPRDYKWLPYLWRSLNKYVTGFRDVFLVTDLMGAVPSLPCLPAIRFRMAPEELSGYVGQQIVKLQAWQYTDADYVLYLDSDIVFTRPLDVSSDTDLWQEGKPVLWHTPWEDLGNEVPWRGPTAEILGVSPPAETMRRHPFVYPVEFVRRVYDGCGGVSRLLRYSQMSEFNLLGNWALLFEPGVMAARSTRGPMPPPCVRQFRSWDGITAGVHSEMEAMGL